MVGLPALRDVGRLVDLQDVDADGLWQGRYGEQFAGRSFPIPAVRLIAADPESLLPKVEPRIPC
jgi:hypothetical protein